MKALYAALLKAQQEFSPVPKDGKNPAFKSSYATLGSVQETAFPVLHKHGLLVIQSVRTDWQGERGPIVYVGAALVHAETGESIQQEIGLMPAKIDPQGVGSAISYGRRYHLLTMLGLSADDDDGNAASARPAAPQQAQRPAAAPQPQGTPDEVFDGPPITDATARQLHAVGTQLYPDKGLWDEKRPGLVAWATDKRTTSSKELSEPEARRLIAKLQERIDEAAAAQPTLVETPKVKPGKRPEFS